MKLTKLQTIALAMVGIMLSANRVPGQEPVNEQDTFKYSLFLGAFSSNQKDPSFKMVPDAPKASAVHK